MMDVKVLSAAVLGVVLLSSTVLADPTEAARAAGKDATWLFIQTAEKLQFDGTILTPSGVSGEMP